MLPAGTEARFDTITHELRCLWCHTAPAVSITDTDRVAAQSSIAEARQALRQAS